MVESKFDLDITLCVKQGQVEVDQAAVVTNYSDAQVVRSASVQPKLNYTKLNYSRVNQSVSLHTNYPNAQEVRSACIHDQYRGLVCGLLCGITCFSLSGRETCFSLSGREKACTCFSLSEAHNAANVKRTQVA